MATEPRDRAVLRAFFLPLTRQTCADVHVGDATIAAYRNLDGAWRRAPAVSAGAILASGRREEG